MEIKNPLVSVIIPSWNGKHLLQECLTSLQKQSYPNFEVIVVDNGSTDGSVQFLKKFFPKVKIVQLDKNYGFAKAINNGVKSAQGNLVAFLNNDTLVDPKWLEYLV